MFFSSWELLDAVDVICHPYYNGIKLGIAVMVILVQRTSYSED
jgi:hypothetical protein